MRGMNQPINNVRDGDIVVVESSFGKVLNEWADGRTYLVCNGQKMLVTKVSANGTAVGVAPYTIWNRLKYRIRFALLKMKSHFNKEK